MKRKIVPGEPHPFECCLGPSAAWGARALVPAVASTSCNLNTILNCFVCLNIFAFYLLSVEFITLVELVIPSRSL